MPGRPSASLIRFMRILVMVRPTTELWSTLLESSLSGQFISSPRNSQ